MKKLFSTMLIMASMVCVFSSCSEEEKKEEVLPDIPTTIGLKVGETYDLKYTSTWESSKSFVATVDSNGFVTARKVGEAVMSVPSKSLNCLVKVSANYTLYNEHLTNWGITKKEVQSIKGTPDSETDDAFGYLCNSSYAPMEMYMFENNKLVASVVLVKTEYTEQLVNHLMQRYEPIGVDSENYNLYFIDEEEFDDAKTAVVANLYNTSMWMVMYMKNPTTTRSGVGEEAFYDLLRNEISNMNIINTIY